MWLLDSAGLVSEQIPLNPSDYCPYSATGTAMVRCRQPVTMPTAAARVNVSASTGRSSLRQLRPPAGLLLAEEQRRVCGWIGGGDSCRR